MRPHVLFILLLILPIVSAAETFDPRGTSYLEANYSIQGTITVNPTSDTVSYVSAKLYAYPKETEALHISEIKTSPQATFSGDGEQASYVFEWRNLEAGNYYYDLSANIKNSNYLPKVYKKIKFPFEVPSDLKKYTIPTEKTESGDAEIKATANELAAGEDDAYRIMFKIAGWVHSNVDYDESAWQGVASAKDVLRTKRGVCDEYTNLYMALMRSIGFPARYKVGSVYTNIPSVNDFQYHAWAEVWLPDAGWVPVDTTFAEYGWLDPTHIEVMDSQIVEPASLSYKWRNGDVTTSTIKSNVKIIEKKDRLPNIVKTEAWLQEAYARQGSYNIFWLELKNNADFYIHTSATLTKGLPIWPVDKNQKDVLLAPHSSETVGWLFKAPPDSDARYIYLYGFEAETLFSGEPANSTLQISEDGKYLSRAEAESLLNSSENARSETHGKPIISFEEKIPKIIYTGNAYQFGITVKNSGNAPAEHVVVCVDGQCDAKYVGINEETLFNFTVIAVQGKNINRIGIISNDYSSAKDIITYASEKTIFIKIKEFFTQLLSLFH